VSPKPQNAVCVKVQDDGLACRIKQKTIFLRCLLAKLKKIAQDLAWLLRAK